MPIGKDYLAIERSVVECAYAGCETIWVICNDDVQPLIRHRLGDYVQDPVWKYRNYEKRASEFEKPIPIYYVPIHPNDRDRRDCLGWSVLHGAYTSHKISKKMSKWLAPDRYYVSFPYGIYKPHFLREHRKKISSSKNLILSYKNNTIIDGAYLGFTFDFNMYEKILKNFRSKATGMYKNFKTKEKLPIDKRYSARYFSLKEVFGCISVSKVEQIELPEYFNIDSWQNYCDYISLTKGIKKPSENILKYREFNGIGYE